MPRLTLRTLLAYIDDTLAPAEAHALGKKVAESEEAKLLVERIKKVTRRRGLSTPVATNPDDETADPNTVAEYLDNSLDSATIKQFEETCLESDVHLAEVAACHQILTLVLTEPVRVPPQAHRRMYQLVPPPAGEPKRRPNKRLPIGGRLPAPAISDADDADAALLLGMKRYSSSNSMAARLVLFGVAGVLCLLLTAGVILSLQHRTAKPPAIAPGNSYALTQLPIAPPPKEAPAKEPEPELPPDVPIAPPPRVVEPDNKKPVDPGPGLGDPIPAPDPAVRPVAEVRTNRVLVVRQLPDAPVGQWTRLKLRADDEELVTTNTPVMALPGYKADLVIDKKVQLRLWGNVPEQLTYRVLESRIKIHSPPDGFDADITLLGGRIYLRSELDAGVKVRLRLAGEVWDITIPDAESNVLVELISWFEPGTVYARREGSQPKREARFAVVFGTGALTAPARFKTYDKLARRDEIRWDSVKNELSEPRQIEADQLDILLNPNPSDPLKGDFNKQLTRLLTNMADRVTTRENLQVVIRGYIGPQLPVEIPDRDRDLVSRLAIYSHAALADSTQEGANTLTPLVDLLRSEFPWLARQAVVTAFVYWIARDRSNTALLHNVFTSKGLGEADADRLLRLLRGFISPAYPDPARLDELVDPGPMKEPPLLADPEVAIREAALWNLMVVRLESWVPLPLNVAGIVGAKLDSPEFARFLRDMKADVEAFKKRQMK